MILFFIIASPAYASLDENSKRTVIGKIQHRFHQIWFDGTTDLYLTGYSWHNRYAYQAEKIRNAKYNEFAKGGGLGRGFYDEDGDWHALYAMGFSDSHYNFQPLIGYGFLKMLHLPKTFNAGVGFTWFITQRKDIFHGIPFIGIPLPMVSVGVNRISVYATYVPGKTNIGNVLFLFGKITCNTIY